MKLVPVVLLCVFLISEYNTADGKIVNNIFEKVHNTAEKVKEDVHNLFQPLRNRLHHKKNDDAGKITFEEETSAEKEKEKHTVETTSLKPTTTTEGKTVSTSSESTVSRMVFPTEEPLATTTKSSNGTDKDGKENFSGGCLAGYQRTSDGRCMPTF
ncbi:growth-blocking peptide, long form-like isoform X1 [Ostrinia furnacalis]|uniref:Growth-blocking peptide n=1 Tax=Ostrinia furnacalis TaxID=93504 RepID=A0A8F2YFV6_OSTFU|nr:growth-blocking peptide, long form-like isoform X1 [Ostrinia furnacalis]XP_028159332.1 growth-blocking peptide, long form-like isoform X1 [Ostrinia furnacalis]QWX20072.1 growth-blocking peptide [Ostrinia furnacalis]